MLCMTKQAPADPLVIYCKTCWPHTTRLRARLRRTRRRFGITALASMVRHVQHVVARYVHPQRSSVPRAAFRYIARLWKGAQ